MAGLNRMNQNDLKLRTKKFALDVIASADKLPNDEAISVLARQLLRSSTSVVANYRAACRARSKADFFSKMGIVKEEADESEFWLDLLEASAKLGPQQAGVLRREVSELTAIAGASINTARRGQASSNPQPAIRNPQS